jgi:dienelactone hydrolase
MQHELGKHRLHGPILGESGPPRRAPGRIRQAGAIGVAILVAAWTGLLVVACGDDVAAPTAGDPCSAPALVAAREAMWGAMGLPATKLRPPPGVDLRPADFLAPGDGAGLPPHDYASFVFPHPEIDGDEVHGALLLPSPRPDTPLPLLVNLPGHWGAGIESDEVLRLSQTFARAGWAVLQVASRGMEQGSDPVPGWRRSHEAGSVYAEMRVRRGGKTTLGWDVLAGQGAIDLAAAGRFGFRLDVERVVVAGFSGGAERAVALAAREPRVAAAIFGGHEYAFSTEDGHAGCTCGALRGATARDPAGVERRAYWLASAACRPGAPPSSRPVLAWDNAPGDAVDAVLRGLSDVELRGNGGVHGVDAAMVAASVLWAERTLRSAPPRAIRSAIDVVAATAPPSVQSAHRLPYGPTVPGPGRYEQGKPPWATGLRFDPDGVRQRIGLGADGAPAYVEADEARTERVGPAGPARFLLFAPPAPVDGTPSEFVAPTLDPASMGPVAVDAITTGIGSTAERDAVDARRGAGQGAPPLGAVVAALLRAHGEASRAEGAQPGEIGWIGIGAGGVAVVLAAALVGEGGPVLLVDAPLTLWWDGPGATDAARYPAGAIVQPWPAWTLATRPGGGLADPWFAAQALSDRLVWVRPRGGDGAPWAGVDPPGRVAESWDAARSSVRERYSNGSEAAASQPSAASRSNAAGPRARSAASASQSSAAPATRAAATYASTRSRGDNTGSRAVAHNARTAAGSRASGLAPSARAAATRAATGPARSAAIRSAPPSCAAFAIGGSSGGRIGGAARTGEGAVAAGGGCVGVAAGRRSASRSVASMSARA